MNSQEKDKTDIYNLSIHGLIFTSIIGNIFFASGAMLRVIATLPALLGVSILINKRKELSRNQKLFGWILFIISIMIIITYSYMVSQIISTTYY